MKRGLLIVVSAPSGGGKGTILKEMFTGDARLRLSVSGTTRAPRPGEVHGKHYYFLSKEEFEGLLAQGQVLEYTQYCGNYYGTLREPVEKWLSEGLDVILEIEVDGGQQIKELVPDCVSIFIMPPSMEVLERRLRNRGTEDEETISKRLEVARKEIPCAKDYDYIVYNDELKVAVKDMQAILRAEKLKYARNTGAIERVLHHAETICKYH